MNRSNLIPTDDKHYCFASKEQDEVKQLSVKNRLEPKSDLRLALMNIKNKDNKPAQTHEIVQYLEIA